MQHLTTIEAYVEKLQPEQQLAVQQLYELFNKKLPKGFEATMQYGMISFVVPHSIYPKGYHCKPTDALPFLSIAAQKNNISLYHMGIYAMPNLLEWFTTNYPLHSTTKLDMGKSCIRFKKIEGIPFTLLEQLATKITVEEWIHVYEATYIKKK